MKVNVPTIADLKYTRNPVLLLAIRRIMYSVYSHAYNISVLTKKTDSTVRVLTRNN